MFGLNKLKEAQKRAEEIRSELGAMEFEGESLNGMAKATCNGSKEITSVQINESAFKVRPQADVEKMVVQAVNEALSKAEQASHDKLREVLPNIPGLQF